MAKKISWPAIKKRYLAGEKPNEIAKDYGITSKQVRDKASREGWGALKATLCDEIATEVRQQAKAEISQTTTLMGSIYTQILQNINETMSTIKPTRERGQDIPEAYHLEAFKQGIKHHFKMEAEAAKNQPTGEKPGINIIAPDADQGSDSIRPT